MAQDIVESDAYLLTVLPALGRSGGTGLVSGTVSVASCSHSESGGLGNAGERGSGNAKKGHSEVECDRCLSGWW